MRAAQTNDYPLAADQLPEIDDRSTRKDLSKEVRFHLAETDVRRSAIEAIAVLAEKLKKAKPPARLEHDELVPTMTALAADANPVIRSTVAFALGVLEDDSLRETQRHLLIDPNADVRFNAAVGLARAGDEAAVDVLIEMLEPADNAGVALEKHPALREQKLGLILVNGLRAVEQLLKANKELDPSRLKEAIGKVKDNAELPRQITLEAMNLLRKLDDDQS